MSPSSVHGLGRKASSSVMDDSDKENVCTCPSSLLAFSRLPPYPTPYMQFRFPTTAQPGPARCSRTIWRYIPVTRQATRRQFQSDRATHRLQEIATCSWLLTLLPKFTGHLRGHFRRRRQRYCPRYPSGYVFRAIFDPEERFGFKNPRACPRSQGGEAGRQRGARRGA